jgi:hypothetical protein
VSSADVGEIGGAATMERMTPDVSSEIVEGLESLTQNAAAIDDIVSSADLVTKVDTVNKDTLPLLSSHSILLRKSRGNSSRSWWGRLLQEKEDFGVLKRLQC